jgi:putative hemolysin
MPASLSGPRLALLLALSATLLALAACGDDAQPRSGDQGDNNSANNAANNGANNGGDNNDQENNGGDNNDAPLVGLRLSVGDAQARSCEVVILDPDERVESVSFGQGAQGQSMRRGGAAGPGLHRGRRRRAG